MLAGFEGQAQRDFAREPEVWSAAETGERFRAGDAVRTGERSKAQLDLTGGGGLKLGSKTAVRFLSEAPGAAPDRVRVESGVAEVEAGAEALGIETPSGAARVKRGSRVRVSLDDSGGTRVDVLFGAAIIEEDGVPVELGSGQTAMLPAGGAVEPPPPEVPLVVVPTPRPPPPGPEPVVQLEAGESAVIHDARTPVPVAIRFAERCDGEAEVRVLGKSGVLAVARGRGEATVEVPEGVERVEVHCLDGEVVAGGRVRIAREPERRQKAGARPPEQRLDADGKQHVVRYADRPPKLALRWPDPPPVDAFVLVLSQPGKEPQRFAVERPDHRFDPGTLGDGRWEWWFEAAESDRASPRSRLELAPDPDAAADVSADVKGSAIHIFGVAQPGAKVSVDGQPLPVDKKRRFKGQVPTSTRAVTIRVEHPTTGTHYFVRRPKPEPRR